MNSWLSSRELNDLFRLETDVFSNIVSSRNTRTKEDWLLILAVKGRYGSCKLLQDLWPLLDPKEDSWVWNKKLNKRFETYLKKYPLDSSKKKIKLEFTYSFIIVFVIG